MTAPMDPDRLAALRGWLGELRPTDGIITGHLTELLADRDHWENQTKELLAVIHGDGGHHSDLVGIAQSLADAHDALPTLRAQLTESNRERDQARREVCEVTELGRHDMSTTDHELPWPRRHALAPGAFFPVVIRANGRRTPVDSMPDEWGGPARRDPRVELAQIKEADEDIPF